MTEVELRSCRVNAKVKTHFLSTVELVFCHFSGHDIGYCASEKFICVCHYA